MLQYATMYISLSTLDYRAVWWRLFHAPCASEWANVLNLAHLLFSLPASNGSLERAFSQVNVIKLKKRTSLSSNTLDDLLMVSTMTTPLKDFDPDNAIDLWWGDKVRRPTQKKKQCNDDQPCSSTVQPDLESESETESLQLLDNWDNWMESD